MINQSFYCLLSYEEQALLLFFDNINLQFQRNFINSCSHFPYNSSYNLTFDEGLMRFISLRLLNASFGEGKIPAPIPAPRAAPILPSFSYNSTGTFVASTNASAKRSLKNIFAFPTRMTE